MKAEQVLKLVLGSTLVYAVVAACSSKSGFHAGHDGGGIVGDAMADVNQSGSRIKAQYFAGSDGSKAFAAMYDTETKQTCAFAVASDGKYRCLPTGTGVIANTAVYSDMGCTLPILEVAKSCTTPPPYIGTAETSCAGTPTFHVYPSAGAFTPGASVYVRSGSGTSAMCSMIKASTAVDFVKAGTEVAPTTFVEGTLQSE